MPLFLLFVLVAFALLLLLLVHSWRQTPHGPLALMPAILLRRLPRQAPTAMSLSDERARTRRLARLAGGRRLPVQEVRDLDLGEAGAPLRARLYQPAPAEAPRPVILYYHGGGWRTGDLDSHDRICRRLARAGRLPVLAVDYRRTPEYRYPAALDDAYAALQWVAANGSAIGVDGARPIVMGDSAGGNLAAAVCLRARDEAGPAIACQVLVYPVIDLTNTSRPSYLDFATGYFLTRDRMQGFIDDYVPTLEQRTESYASPIFAATLAKLPPALIITAAFDPLRDEGKAYADRLAAAGVPVRYREYEGMIHGFFGMPLMGPNGVGAVRLVGEVLRKELER